MKLPDCELPRVIDHGNPRWPTGLGVPTSSCAAFLKNVPMSRNAAMPIPSTGGSWAVNTSW